MGFLPQTSIIEQKPLQSWGWVPWWLPMAQSLSALLSHSLPAEALEGAAAGETTLKEKWQHISFGSWLDWLSLSFFYRVLGFASNYLAPRASEQGCSWEEAKLHTICQGSLGSLAPKTLYKKELIQLWTCRLLQNESYGFSGNRNSAYRWAWGQRAHRHVSPDAALTPLLRGSESRLVVSDSLRTHGLYSPWNSPGQKTGVGRLSFLQGIFPTRGSNPYLPHCMKIRY